jgi:hypothetical protein
LPLLKLEGPQVALRWLIELGWCQSPAPRMGAKRRLMGALGNSSEQAEVQALLAATTAWR